MPQLLCPLVSIYDACQTYVQRVPSRTEPQLPKVLPGQWHTHWWHSPPSPFPHSLYFPGSPPKQTIAPKSYLSVCFWKNLNEDIAPLYFSLLPSHCSLPGISRSEKPLYPVSTSSYLWYRNNGSLYDLMEIIQMPKPKRLQICPSPVDALKDSASWC